MGNPYKWSANVAIVSSYNWQPHFSSLNVSRIYHFCVLISVNKINAPTQFRWMIYFSWKFDSWTQVNRKKNYCNVGNFMNSMRFMAKPREFFIRILWTKRVFQRYTFGLRLFFFLGIGIFHFPPCCCDWINRFGNLLWVFGICSFSFSNPRCLVLFKLWHKKKLRPFNFGFTPQSTINFYLLERKSSYALGSELFVFCKFHARCLVATAGINQISV